jgi:hypothetical protein
LVVWPHQRQFRHYVVGEQDLGRTGLQSAPGLALHVTGVFGEADGKRAAGALLVPLLEFLQRLNL